VLYGLSCREHARITDSVVFGFLNDLVGLSSEPFDRVALLPSRGLCPASQRFAPGI
jgi:hypothetical protein